MSLIAKPSEVEKLASTLSQHEIIAFDTEFIRENTFFPQLEIIQVATDAESWLIDAKALDTSGLGPFLEILESPKILKIAHAIQGDQEAIFSKYGVTVKNTLDTAIAAALTGMGEAIGLGNLLKSRMGVQLKKGHARTNWAVRPLPPQLEEYAHLDVKHLVELARLMLGDLDKRGRRDWAFELCKKLEQESMYQSEPEEIAERLGKSGRLDRKGYTVLVELVRWREERVRKLNIPRRWLADDSVLVDIASTKPKDLEHLGHFRGLNKGEIKSQGVQLLKIIAEAQAAPEEKLPKRVKHEAPSTNESQVMDLLKTYIGMLSDEHQIASKHLMTSGQMLPVIRSGAQTVEDLIKDGTLTRNAATLIGDDIIALLNGKKAIGVRDYRVCIIDMKS